MHENQFGAQPQALPKSRTLLRNAYDIYRANAKTFLGITVLLPITAAIIALAGSVLDAVFVLSLPQTTAIALSVLGLTIAVVAFVAVLWVQVALLVAIRDHRQQLRIRDAFLSAWPKLLSFFWMALIISLLIAGGLFFFVIPGILFAVWFSLAYYVFITEDTRGVSAALQSKEYVRGYWGNVLWRIIVIALIILAAHFFVGLIALPFENSSATVMQGVGYLLSATVTILLTPLISTYLFLLYTALRDLHPERTLERPVTRSRRWVVGIAIAGFALIVLLLAGGAVLGTS